MLSAGLTCLKTFLSRDNLYPEHRFFIFFYPLVDKKTKILYNLRAMNRRAL